MPPTAPTLPLDLRRRCGLIAALGVLATVAVFLHAPVPQDERFHAFADQRTWCGIPHPGDVLSNLPFLVVGVMGVVALLRHARVGPLANFATAWERWPAVTAFAGLVLTALGSTWYHWSPDDGRLLYDRLPLTMVFMALFTVVIADRAGPRLARAAFVPLLATGVISVLWWSFSEAAGHGDLRLYGLVQFFPMLAIPLLLVLLPRRYTGGVHVFIVLLLYGVAKLCEMLDAQLYALLGVITGHTVKHLLAAFAMWWLLGYLMLRRALPEGEALGASYREGARR